MDLKRLFKNKTNGMKVVGKILQSKQEGVYFTDDILQKLLMYHPSKNTEEIESLVVRPHKLFKNPTLYIKTRTNEEDISCKKCLANLFEKYKETTYDQNLLRAMRGSIFKGKRQDFFLKYVNRTCQTCSSEADTIDHYPVPFSQIVRGYTSVNDNIPIKYNGYDWEISDVHLLDSWKKYHDKIATYRMLCKSCNSRFGGLWV